MRRKKRLVELIRNFANAHYHFHHAMALSHETEEHEEKFEKSKQELLDYIDQTVFMKACDSCFNAAHPERERRPK